MDTNVVWQGRPKVARYFLGRLFLLVLFFAFTAGVGVMIQGRVTHVQAKNLWEGMAIFWAVLGILASLYFLTIYQSQSYVVRAHGIELKTGLVMRDHKTFLWNQFRGIELQQGILDRLMGTGTIRFSTGEFAGANGQMTPRYDSLPDIADAQNVYRLIQEAMSKAVPPRPF
jgi:uncharacterized membrane protein YdbT with pleckstrin-like domain